MGIFGKIFAGSLGGVGFGVTAKGLGMTLHARHGVTLTIVAPCGFPFGHCLAAFAAVASGAKHLQVVGVVCAAA